MKVPGHLEVVIYETAFAWLREFLLTLTITNTDTTNAETTTLLILLLLLTLLLLHLIKLLKYYCFYYQ